MASTASPKSANFTLAPRCLLANRRFSGFGKKTQHTLINCVINPIIYDHTHLDVPMYNPPLMTVTDCGKNLLNALGGVFLTVKLACHYIVKQLPTRHKVKDHISHMIFLEYMVKLNCRTNNVEPVKGNGEGREWQ